jgi:hypothetical protein
MLLQFGKPAALIEPFKAWDNVGWLLLERFKPAKALLRGDRGWRLGEGGLLVDDFWGEFPIHENAPKLDGEPML